MNRNILISGLLLLAGSRITFAQPATDNAPKATNPANIKAGGGAMTPEQTREMMAKMQEQMAAVMKMTPEQQREMMRQTQEKLLRMSFDRAGFKDLKLQDTVVAFVAEQEKSREAVRKAAARVYLALEPQGAPTDKQGMTIWMVNYLNAVDDAKAARETATKNLDKAIGFSGNPHLMALLTLSGLIGDASWFTSDVIMTGTMSIAGLAPFVDPARAAQ